MSGRIEQELVTENLTATKTARLPGFIGSRGIPHFSEVDLVAAGIQANRFPIWPTVTLGNPGSSQFAVNNLTAGAVLLNRTGTITRIGFCMNVNGGAGTLARVGLYVPDATTGIPSFLVPGSDSGDLVADAGAVVYRSSPVNIPITAPTFLWGAFVASVGAPNPTVLANNQIFAVDSATAVGVAGFSVAFPYAPLPAQFPRVGLGFSGGLSVAILCIVT